MPEAVARGNVKWEKFSAVLKIYFHLDEYA